MLKQLLADKKEAILKKWQEQIFSSYPADSASFFGNKKDQFANPVGHTILSETSIILDEILDGKSVKKSASHLDEIIKMRAIQGFSPSNAVSFVLELKDVIYAQLKNDLKDKETLDDFMSLSKRIDEIALTAFDVFADRREKISELRIREIKKRVPWIIRKTNGFSDVEGDIALSQSKNETEPFRQGNVK